jgi:hypothetical protein
MHVFFLVFCLFLSACNRPDAYPERKDPIYHDLENQVRASQKEVSSLLGERDSAKADIQNAKPQTGEIKLKWNTYFEVEKQHAKAAQMLKYNELRLETRKREARKSYLEAFGAGKDWPDPEEYAAYERQKKLRDAPKDWNARLKEELTKRKEKKSAGAGTEKEAAQQH